MVKPIFLLVITSVMAAGAFFAVGLHSSLRPQSPEKRIVAMYQDFKQRFGVLRATPAEDNFRLKVFEKNVALIEEVNSKNLGYSFGVNQFADMLKDEFSAAYTGLGSWKDSLFWGTFGQEEAKKEKIDEAKYKPIVDWSDQLNPVAQQKGCASCYAFSSIAPLELQIFKEQGKKIQLAPQELVDCSGDEGNTGCKGGWMHQTYDYIIKKGELSMESNYPYLAQDANSCRLDKAKVQIPLKSYVQLKPHLPSEIMDHLQETVVPSAVDCSGLMFYKEGVFNGECNSNINHAVVIVGYGEDKGSKYWKVKNSWGETWGEKGYIRIQREIVNGHQGKCGITDYNVVPHHIKLIEGL